MPGDPVAIGKVRGAPVLVTAVVGNVHESPLPDGVHLETVTMPSDQLTKRIQRVSTDHGREVGIRLGLGSPDLRDGDVLHLAAGEAIVVRIEPTDVLVIRARSILEMAQVAHTLGNRHLQAQFFGRESEYGGEVMVVAYDHTVAEYLDRTGVPYQREERVMRTPFRHSQHTH